MTSKTREELKTKKQRKDYANLLNVVLPADKAELERQYLWLSESYQLLADAHFDLINEHSYLENYVESHKELAEGWTAENINRIIVEEMEKRKNGVIKGI